MIGRVVWFDVKKGFGFIRADGKDWFAHYSKIEAPAGEFRLLEENEIVEFEPVMIERNGLEKPQAVHIRRKEEKEES
jgi:cold shock CspA family protein